jgi:hypothetical protein
MIKHKQSKGTNMKQPHKHAECIKAWADGAEIETWMKSDNAWQTVCNPIWANNREYRIKPQPVIVKKYTFYDRIERCVINGDDLNKMVAQAWYNKSDPMEEMLEWTFTDGKLTSITII